MIQKKKLDKTKKKAMSLQKKLVISMGTLGLLAIIVLTTIAAVVGGNGLKEIAVEKIQSEVKGISESLYFYTVAEATGLDGYAWDQDIKTLFNLTVAEKNNPSDELNRVLDIFNGDFEYEATNNSGIDAVFAIDKNGIVASASSKDMIGKDASNESFFQTLKSGELRVISDATTAIGSEKTVTVIATSITDSEGNMLGVVGKYIASELYDALLETYQDENYYYFILDSNENIIYHKDKDLLGKSLDITEISNALKNGENIVEYEYNGKKEICTYSKIEGTGWKIFSAVPINVLNAPVSNIVRKLFIAAVLLMISMLIVIRVISKSIVSPIKQIRDAVGRVAHGDLTIKVEELQSSKEVLELSKDFNEMIDNLRELIKETSTTVEKVEEASTNLCALSEEVAASNGELTKQVSVISQNTSKQAVDASTSSEKTQELGEYIENLENKNILMEKQGELVISSLETNADKLNYLMSSNVKSKESFDSVMSTVESLIENISNISNIIGVIDNISKQTSLLSLNASIESARAGEAGKGFAVVAAEIRSLADEVQKATNDITNIIKSIDGIVGLTRNSLDESSEINKHQNTAYMEVKSAFEGMRVNLSEMIDITDGIGKEIDAVNVKKQEVLQVMEEVAAEAEEIASVTEEANQSIDEQSLAFDNVSSNAEELIDFTQNVKKSLDKFIV